MDLYQLKTFLEAARTLNFTKTAGSLGVTPSAVSRSVALLERSVGKPLFLRSKRKVYLTPAGESLKVRAERIFDQVQEAEEELRGGEGGPASLRIGSREMITHYLLPQPLKALRASSPRTHFKIHELSPAAMVDAVKNDKLDLGLLYAPVQDPSVEGRSLGKIRSHVYASKEYLKKNPSKRLEDHGFVAPREFHEDPAAPRADGFPDHRVQRRIRFEAEFLETHRRFVLDGLCVGVLPDLVMRGDKAKVRTLDGPPLHREIYFFKRRGRSLPSVVEDFVAAVKKAVRT